MRLFLRSLVFMQDVFMVQQNRSDPEKKIMPHKYRGHPTAVEKLDIAIHGKPGPLTVVLVVPL